MKTLVRPIVLTVVAALLAGCGDSMSQQEARQKLADLNVKYSKESFVQHALEGDQTAVDLFLAAGMDPNARVDADIPISAAFAEDLHNEAEPERRHGETIGLENSTLLSVASAGGEAEVVRALLEAGADPNVEPSGEGLQMAPLLWATMGGHTEVTRQLLEHGADPNTIDSHAADEIVGFDLGSVTPLIMASLRNDAEPMQTLLEAGAEPRKVPKKPTDLTALQSAALLGHTEVVRTLLEAGVGTDQSVQSALSVASNDEIARLLRDAGAHGSRPRNSGEPYEKNQPGQQATEDTRERMKLVRSALLRYEDQNENYPRTLETLVDFVRQNQKVRSEIKGRFGGESFTPNSLIHSPRTGKKFKYEISKHKRFNTYKLTDPDQPKDYIGTTSGDPTKADAASWE